MQKSFLWYLFIGSFTLLLSCNGSENSNEEETPTVDSTVTETTEVEAAPKERTVYAWVDKLRIREAPNLKSKEVVQVAEGTALTFTGEESEEKIKITLREREMEAPFYKVITPDGKTGWTFAGALTNRPVNVQNYYVVISFDERDLDPEEDSGDWGYYWYEMSQLLIGTGVMLVHAEGNYHEVPIKNGSGEVIGVENIADFVKEHTIGLVCIKRGEDPKFVAYDPQMGEAALEAFGMKPPYQ